jgi:putative aldouronate transport system substrate-binding protein
MKRFKLISMLLALMFIFSLVSTGAVMAEESDPFFIEGGEGKTLTVWVPMDYIASMTFTSLAEHPFFQWLEEKTGVSVTFVHPTWEQLEQQMTQMITTGEYYDILVYPTYPGGPQQAVNDGVYRDLMLYLDDYMPHFKQAVSCSDGSFGDWEWSEAEKDLYQPQPQGDFLGGIMTVKNNMWCVTQVWANEIPAECGPIIRQDWLEEEGLEMPETLEELEIVLEAFKQRGVIPMTIAAEGYETVYGSSTLNSAFDLGGYFTLMEDGITVDDHMFIKPAFKDYLTLLNSWYEKGYIDPDFMNSDYDTDFSKMLDDRLGIWIDYIGDPSWLPDMYEGEEDFDIQPMPLPRKDKDQILRAYQKYLSDPYYEAVISASCEYPEIAAQWLDKLYIEEVMLRATYGVEGQTFVYEDGVPVYLESIFFDEEIPFDVLYSTVLMPNSFPGYWSMRAHNILHSNNGNNKELSPMMKAGQVWSQNAIASMRIPFTRFDDDGYGLMADIMVQVDTYAQPMILKFITGAESLEKFDEFVDTCKSLGIEEARDMWQTAYSAMQGD